jgi:hypothetical protein
VTGLENTKRVSGFVCEMPFTVYENVALLLSVKVIEAVPTCVAPKRDPSYALNGELCVR